MILVGIIMSLLSHAPGLAGIKTLTHFSLIKSLRGYQLWNERAFLMWFSSSWIKTILKYGISQLMSHQCSPNLPIVFDCHDVISIVVKSSRYMGNFDHRSNLTRSFVKVFLRFTDSSMLSKFVINNTDWLGLLESENLGRPCTQISCKVFFCPIVAKVAHI